VLIRGLHGGFVPHSSGSRSFIIKQIGGFVFQKALSFQPLAINIRGVISSLLPFAFCHLRKNPRPRIYCGLARIKTKRLSVLIRVDPRLARWASFLIFPTAGPLLSSKSVASFFKKALGP